METKGSASICEVTREQKSKERGRKLLRPRERDSVLDCGDRDARRKPASAAPLSRGEGCALDEALCLACESGSAFVWCRTLFVFTLPYSL